MIDWHREFKAKRCEVDELRYELEALREKYTFLGGNKAYEKKKRRLNATKEFKTASVRVRGRSNGACESCYKDYGKHIHHKDKDRTNNNIDNLIYLCIACHRKEHPHMVSFI